MQKYLIELLRRYPILKDISGDIIEGYNTLVNTFGNSGKLLVAGNGGSAADADHIVAELMKGFKMKRNVEHDFAKVLVSVDKARGNELAEKLQNALPAISLCNHIALTTAYANDVDGLLVFAQQLYGYGEKKDVFLGITTSGNSPNIIYAAVTAKSLGMKVIGLTGSNGGELESIADIMVKVPQTETFLGQELHIPIYHCWCLMLEEYFYKR